MIILGKHIPSVHPAHRYQHPRRITHPAIRFRPTDYNWNEIEIHDIQSSPFIFSIYQRKFPQNIWKTSPLAEFVIL